MVARAGRHAHRVPLWAIATVALLGLTTPGCSDLGDPSDPTGGVRDEILVPEEGDWVDHGPLFQAGSPGDWDHLLWGGFTATALRLPRGHHLYYQGSDSYREEYDPSVCHRSIGVAVGDAQLAFEKFGGNPILRWAPNDECEEGAAAGAAVLGPDGDVLLYYGANTITGRTTVSADVRVARSADGTTFEDSHVVLDHQDDTVWGHGDELFPLLAFSEAAVWYLLYVPNGTPVARQLAIAWGTSPERLSATARVRDPRGRPVPVWGPAGFGRVGPGRVAVFLKDGPDADLEVRLLDLRSPDRMSDPVQIYAFDEVRQATVILDEARGEWLMFYRADSHYGLKTASVRPLP